MHACKRAFPVAQNCRMLASTKSSCWGNRIAAMSQAFLPVPLLSFVKGAVCGYVFFSRHLLGGIAADDLPPLVFEGAELCRNACKLARDAPVVQFRADVDAALKLARIEHDLPDHLEDFALKDMGADLGIAAAFDLCPIVHVLLGAPIAAVHGPMIDRHLARWPRD